MVKVVLKYVLLVHKNLLDIVEAILSLLLESVKYGGYLMSQTWILPSKEVEASRKCSRGLQDISDTGLPTSILLFSFIQHVLKFTFNPILHIPVCG
jgi:hypothetical protein